MFMYMCSVCVCINVYVYVCVHAYIHIVYTCIYIYIERERAINLCGGAPRHCLVVDNHRYTQGHVSDTIPLRSRLKHFSDPLPDTPRTFPGTPLRTFLGPHHGRLSDTSSDTLSGHSRLLPRRPESARVSRLIIIRCVVGAASRGVNLLLLLGLCL